jgi:hypothetical protein
MMKPTRRTNPDPFPPVIDSNSGEAKVLVAAPKLSRGLLFLRGARGLGVGVQEHAAAQMCHESSKPALLRGSSLTRAHPGGACLRAPITTCGRGARPACAGWRNRPRPVRCAAAAGEVAACTSGRRCCNCNMA